MDTRFYFTNDDRKYTIDNKAYSDKTVVGVRYLIKVCPKCHKHNSVEEKTCLKCGTKLNDKCVKVVSRAKRTGLGLLIGCLISGFVIAGLAALNNKRTFGALPTWIIVGICIALGTLLSGKKEVIDEKASMDYVQYRKRIQKSNDNRTIVDDPEQVARYDLVKHCYKCGSETEKDSIFCSNCGCRIDSVKADSIKDKGSEYQKIKDFYGDAFADDIINYWAILYVVRMKANVMGGTDSPLYRKFYQGTVDNVIRERGEGFYNIILNLGKSYDEKKLAEELDVESAFDEGKYQFERGHMEIDISELKSDK